MLNIAKETIEFYTKNWKTPTIKDVNFDDASLLEKQGSVFVTIYQNWEIRGSAWNIKEIKSSLAGEIIENTIEAISKDFRFKSIKQNEIFNLKIRIDLIKNRKILKDNEIKKLDPVKYWVLVIKKDYDKMVMILPNINPKLLSWEDFIPVLKEKLQEKKFEENKYIIYSIETEIIRD